MQHFKLKKVIHGLFKNNPASLQTNVQLPKQVKFNNQYKDWTHNLVVVVVGVSVVVVVVVVVEMP